MILQSDTPGITFTCSATSNGGTSQLPVTVKRDTTAPLITAPDAVIVEATGFGTPVGLGSPTVSDVTGPTPSVTNDASGLFPVGLTVVTWTATDDAGNSANTNQNVTITDTTAPIIFPRPDVIVEATGTTTPVDLITPFVFDIADPFPFVTNNAPVFFPVGTTTVTWTATDASNNSATSTQNVTVTDTTAPFIFAPTDILIEATDDAGTPVNLGAPFVFDFADPSPLVTNDAPALFPLGTTTVTWTATDASGNSATSTQSVIVTDTTAPSIAAPGDIVVEATDDAGTPVSLGTPVVSDNGDPSPAIGNDAPGLFPLGMTIVTWTATDASGNSATSSQAVTVEDTTAPEISGPSDVIAEATGSSTPVVLGTPFVIDIVDPAPSVTNDAPPAFPLGTTTVIWTATDASGNSATSSQTVLIEDTTSPVLDFLFTDAIVEFGDPLPLPPDVTATDNSGELITVGFSPTIFPGPNPANYTLVRTWTATDSSGNSATTTQTITVVDTTPPSITGPADLTVEATGTSTSVALGTPDVSDVGDPDPSVGNDAPLTFPLGTTVVTWTATDASGNSATSTQGITVVDTTAPSIVAPADVTAEATGTSTPVVLGSPVVVDAVDPSPGISNDSPATFPLGSTIVIWTATDASANSATSSQIIIVEDTTAPLIAAPPDVSTEATDPAGTPVALGAPTVSDQADVSPTVTNNAPATFPVGTTVVTWTATDASNNSASSTQNVTITDTTPPVFDLISADEVVEATGLTTPVALAPPIVSDLGDPDPTVTSDALVAYPLGLTVVTWTATDNKGNQATTTQNVTVIDTIVPSITAPPDVSAEATGVGTPVTLGIATTTDIADPNPAVTNNAPASFLLGGTTVTWTATDVTGNSATDTQIVLITDTTDPVLSGVPGDETIEFGTAIPVPATVTASDNSGEVITVDFTEVRIDGANSSTYTLRRTWTATDSSGNSTSSQQEISVADTTAPSITAPVDVTEEVTNPGTSVNLGNAASSDFGGVEPVVTNDAPELFGLGDTTVTWTATDASGNSATGTQVVTIEDTTPPVLIGVPADVTLEIEDAPPGEPDVIATDNSGEVDVTRLPDVRTDGANPANYTLTRTWKATDSSGNTATSSQIVTVQDTTAPVLSGVPDDETIVFGDSIPDPAIVTATDNSEESISVEFDEERIDGVNPANFLLVRTWTATDATGNSVSGSQTITVVDGTAPSISAPADITAEVTIAGTAVTLGSPIVTDDGDPSPEITNDAPALFPLGETTVTWTATDVTGNTATSTQIVTIVDTTSPSITAPADVTVEVTGTSTTVAIGSATASDIADPSPTITNDAPAAFPLGTTVVTWTATDDSGNSTTTTQNVTVVDTTAPLIIAPSDVIATATGTSTVVELGTPIVIDVGDANPTVTNDAPTSFPPGVTIVTWSVTDASGNSATTTQTVTITDESDTIAPELMVTVASGILWPPNHKMVEINVTIEVSDNVDPDVDVVLTSVTSNESDNSISGGDGNTTDDIQGADIGTRDTTIFLRSERAGSLGGREYTLIYTATDSSGNSTTFSLVLVVPHDQRKDKTEDAGSSATGKSKKKK